MNKSVAEEVMIFLDSALTPKSMREISHALGHKYDSNQISASIQYWLKKGEIIAELKDGYTNHKEYSKNRLKSAKIG